MNKRIVSVLKKARAKIMKGWTQHTSARDKDGLPVVAEDSGAVSWCVLGALSAVSKAGTYQYHDAVEAFRGANRLRAISRWNDRQQSVKRVLAAFDKAIKYAEEQ